MPSVVFTLPPLARVGMLEREALEKGLKFRVSLKLQEQAGKAGARLNSQEARRRADELQSRLERRLGELDRGRRSRRYRRWCWAALSSCPWVFYGR